MTEIPPGEREKQKTKGRGERRVYLLPEQIPLQIISIFHMSNPSPGTLTDRVVAVKILEM